ncbi:MAG: hypothetical protein H2056_00125 [Sphingopyxis sp.]|nr:hypothetical protein [Sphingopyxis sp.]
MLTLGAFLFCYARLVRTHFGSTAALASTAGLLTTVPIIIQLVPLRVDHHGWQLVCMTLCLHYLLDKERPLRSAALLGAVSAIWLEISIEAFPFVIAFIGTMGLRWLLSAPVRNRSLLLSPFNILTVLTALASGVLLLTLKPLDGLVRADCDALSTVHVSAFAVCAIVSSAILAMVGSVRLQPGIWVKLAVCAFAGVAALAVIGIGAPQCAGDSFENLDPVVRQYWFNRTSEGLPVFKLGFEQMVIAGVVMLFGFLGIAHLIRSNDVSMETKIALILIFAATALVGTYVSRTLVYFIVVTSVIIAPLSAALFAQRSDADSIARQKMLRFLAILLLLPYMTGQLVATAIAKLQPVQAATKSVRFVIDYSAAKRCQDSGSIKALRNLPPSNLLSGLDAAPGILQHTEHRVVASGHHRNQAAMRDSILAFVATPDRLAAVIEKRKIDYVVACAAAPEFIFYRDMNPDGNWARLHAGDRYEMLVEQPRLGPFRIWKVRP